MTLKLQAWSKAAKLKSPAAAMTESPSLAARYPNLTELITCISISRDRPLGEKSSSAVRGNYLGKPFKILQHFTAF